MDKLFDWILSIANYIKLLERVGGSMDVRIY
jgi:hypothetical protein